MIEINLFGEEVLQIKMGREYGEEPVPGVQRKVYYWTSAYLVDGLLIDTGCQHTAGELATLLAGQTLKLVVNTHFHEDHIGANHILQQKFGLKILASPESVPLINQKPHLLPYQELVWGCPEPSSVELLPESIKTARFLFDVVPTPGHCKGHISLVERQQGWCFCGDLYISSEPKSARPGEDIAQTCRSMQRLLDLNTERLTLFTSLGNVVTEGHKALRDCIAYLSDLAHKSKSLQIEGFSPVDIIVKLFGKETALAALTEGDISTENLIRAALRADFTKIA